jgi:protein-tyrosine phosphatase
MLRWGLKRVEPKSVNGVYWIDSGSVSSLAIVLCPRGRNLLKKEMQALAHSGVETVVSMLEVEEANRLGLKDEAKMANKVGLRFLSFPIPDHGTPANFEAFQEFVAGLATRVQRGELIGVHCLGSIGRSTLIAACTLIELGFKAQDALQAVETARRCPVPDTEEQEQWIRRYGARVEIPCN